MIIRELGVLIVMVSIFSVILYNADKREQKRLKELQKQEIIYEI